MIVVFVQAQHGDSLPVSSQLPSHVAVFAAVVSLESEAALIDYYKGYGGTLTRLSVSRAVSIQDSDRFSAWRPALPITQWIWEKQGARS